MPITIIAPASTGSIPANKVNATNMRKSLVFVLTAGDAVWGWNSDITANGAVTAGIAMVIGTPVAMSADDGRLDDAIYFLTTGGASITWQAQLK